MITRSSAELRQNYDEIVNTCRRTSEPVFIINDGEEDLVVMDVKSYRREKMLRLRQELEDVEEERLNGNEGCTLDELEAYLDKVIERA